MSAERMRSPPISFESALAVSFLLSTAFSAVDSAIVLSDPNFSSLYDVSDTIIEWFVVGLVLLSLLLGASSFIYHTLGYRGTGQRILVGVFLLGIEASLIPRPIQVGAFSGFAHALPFVVLGLLAALAYSAKGGLQSVTAGLSVLAVGVLQGSSGIPYDPLYNLIYGIQFIAGGTTTALAIEVSIASIGNLAVSVLWGFLVGDILFGNVEVGSFYSKKKPILKILFLVTQVVLISYLVYLLLNYFPLTPNLLEQDQFYLALDVLASIFLVAYWLSNLSGQGFNATTFLRKAYIVVGTSFLVPTLYPTLDSVLRIATIVPFILPFAFHKHQSINLDLSAHDSCSMNLIPFLLASRASGRNRNTKRNI